MLEGRQLHEKSFHFMFFPSQFTGLSPKKRNAIISNPGNSSSIHKVIDIRSTKHPLAGENILPKLPFPSNVENVNLLQKYFLKTHRFFHFSLLGTFHPNISGGKNSTKWKKQLWIVIYMHKKGQIQEHL